MPEKTETRTETTQNVETIRFILQRLRLSDKNSQRYLLGVSTHVVVLLFISCDVTQIVTS